MGELRCDSIEKILAETTGLDWDAGNIYKIWETHQVSLNEAEEIFFNKPLLLLPDDKHSIMEQCYSALGKTDKERRLFITWTVRHASSAKHGSLVRVISARDLSRKERTLYAGQI